MINMWKHYCKVEEDDMEIGEGEECNWCGEEESFGGENKNIEKLSPQPQLAVALGLVILSEEPAMSVI